MGLFSFFKKKKHTKRDFGVDVSNIKVDIHAHYLPGIDDGSASMEESLEMLRRMKAHGFSKVICTPHVMAEHFTNSTEVIKSGQKALQEASRAAGIDIEIGASAEYNFDRELLKRLEENDILSFKGGDYEYLLFELSYFNEPMGLEDLIFKIKQAGYVPVLAHPERYPYYGGNLEQYKRLKALGVLFQLNINSLAGLYSSGARQVAAWLIDNEMIEFVGSDAHKTEHCDLLKDAFMEEKMHQLVESGKLMNLYV